MMPQLSFLFLTDTEPPAIQCPSNVTLFTNIGNSTAFHRWNLTEVSDNSGLLPVTNCSSAMTTYFPLGQNEVLCSAVDNSSNDAMCNFFVFVIGKDFTF